MVIFMKICDFSSLQFKNAVKMCAAASFVLAYFINMGITYFYDVIFPVSFIVLIFRYFSVE
jgi:hypothetical protein